MALDRMEYNKFQNINFIMIVKKDREYMMNAGGNVTLRPV